MPPPPPFFPLPPSRRKVDRATWRETDEGAGSENSSVWHLTRCNTPSSGAFRATFPREGRRGLLSKLAICFFGVSVTGQQCLKRGHDERVSGDLA